MAEGILGTFEGGHVGEMEGGIREFFASRNFRSQKVRLPPMSTNGVSRDDEVNRLPRGFPGMVAWGILP
jgi:hypothetical protein